MSDQGQDQQVDTATDEELSPGDLRRMLKEANAAREAAEAKARVLEREQAFTAAGIPTEGPGALVRKAYDGEADAEAIRSFAAEYGITGTDGSGGGDTAAQAPQTATDPAAANQPEVPEATTQAAQAVQAAAAASAGAPDAASLDARFAAAQTIEEIEAIANEAGLGPRM